MKAKTPKPTYTTTSALDATSTASQMRYDMKEVEVPEYIVFSQPNFPVICQNYIKAIDYARFASQFALDKDVEFKIFETSRGMFIGTFVNGKLIAGEEGGEE